MRALTGTGSRRYSGHIDSGGRAVLRYSSPRSRSRAQDGGARAADGEWRDVDEAHPRNAIEYNTPVVPGSPGWFVGFIEDPATVPNATRIAFGLDAESRLRDLEALVLRAGGRIVERSSDESYPALFFEDPAGTRLEICARRPRA